MPRCNKTQCVNPKTGRCKTPCKDGRVTNPRTGRCVKKSYLRPLDNYIVPLGPIITDAPITPDAPVTPVTPVTSSTDFPGMSNGAVHILKGIYDAAEKSKKDVEGSLMLRPTYLGCGPDEQNNVQMTKPEIGCGINHIGMQSGDKYFEDHWVSISSRDPSMVLWVTRLGGDTGVDDLRLFLRLSRYYNVDIVFLYRDSFWRMTGLTHPTSVLPADDIDTFLKLVHSMSQDPGFGPHTIVDLSSKHIGDWARIERHTYGDLPQPVRISRPRFSTTRRIQISAALTSSLWLMAALVWTAPRDSTIMEHSQDVARRMFERGVQMTVVRAGVTQISHIKAGIKEITTLLMEIGSSAPKGINIFTELVAVDSPHGRAIVKDVIGKVINKNPQTLKDSLALLAGAMTSIPEGEREATIERINGLVNEGFAESGSPDLVTVGTSWDPVPLDENDVSTTPELPGGIETTPGDVPEVDTKDIVQYINANAIAVAETFVGIDAEIPRSLNSLSAPGVYLDGIIQAMVDGWDAAKIVWAKIGDYIGNDIGSVSVTRDTRNTDGPRAVRAVDIASHVRAHRGDNVGAINQGGGTGLFLN